MATCFEVDWMIPELLSTVQLTWLMVNAHDPLNLVYLNALRFGSFTTITKPNELDQHCDKKYGIYFPFQWITFNKIHTKMQFWCFKLYMLFSGIFAHTYIEVLSFSIQMSKKKKRKRSFRHLTRLSSNWKLSRKKFHCVLFPLLFQSSFV